MSRPERCDPRTFTSLTHHRSLQQYFRSLDVEKYLKPNYVTAVTTD